jgi:hypothetical protein
MLFTHAIPEESTVSVISPVLSRVSVSAPTNIQYFMIKFINHNYI